MIVGGTRRATCRCLDWNCRLDFRRIWRRSASAGSIGRNCFHRRKISGGAGDCPSSSNRRIFGSFWRWSLMRCAFAKFRRKTCRSGRRWSNCRCNRYRCVRHYYSACCWIRSVHRDPTGLGVGWVQRWMESSGSNADAGNDGGDGESRED